MRWLVSRGSKTSPSDSPPESNVLLAATVKLCLSGAENWATSGQHLFSEKGGEIVSSEMGGVQRRV